MPGTVTRLRIGHSPDPDDAFMFYAVTHGKVPTEGFEIEHKLEDIETLNRRARRGEYEVSAISLATYPAVKDRYRLLSSGASVGDDYGPVVVSREKISPHGLDGETVAIPGFHTTSGRVFRLWAKEVGISPVEREVPFDEVLPRVLAGDFTAGVLIHEGQLTYEAEGASLVEDLGVWWKRRTGTPLVLGVNVARRDLGDEAVERIEKILSDSIRYALDHREEALAYALRYGRGLDAALADRFVAMYVNHYTVDLGEAGRAGLKRLLAEAV